VSCPNEMCVWIALLRSAYYNFIYRRGLSTITVGPNVLDQKGQWRRAPFCRFWLRRIGKILSSGSGAQHESAAVHAAVAHRSCTCSMDGGAIWQPTLEVDSGVSRYQRTC